MTPYLHALNEKDKTMSNPTKFQQTRQDFKKALQTDDGLYISFHANIAMLLFDRHGIRNPSKRDAAAGDILKLIFDLEGDWSFDDLKEAS